MEDRSYKLVNLTILFVAANIIYIESGDLKELFTISTSGELAVVILTAIFVNATKLVRLYVAMVGSGIKFNTFLQQFCKVMFVSVLLPFKLGDIFRIYCFGKAAKDMARASVAVILDRFADTLALVAILIAVSMIASVGVPAISYLLLGFLLCCTVGYCLFPSLCKFWRGYLLQAKASVKHLNGLALLSRLELLYVDINKVLQGKVFIMVVLSLIAWAVELLGIYVLSSDEIAAVTVSEHMMSAFTGAYKGYFALFVGCNIAVYLSFYVLSGTVRMMGKQ